MNRFISILASIAVLGFSALAVHDGRAYAQPAAAIGHPLPDGKLPTGTISVRVVAGSPSSPVVGSDVTLLINGEPRIARTDAAGRATFAGLTVGAQVQARIADSDGKEVTSDAFGVPDEGGARVMLSTKPFQGMGGMPGGGAGGPMGAGGMPEARTLSGQPRPERSDPPGTYTVLLTYNDLQMKDGRPTDPNPPVGVSVAMVGYGADDSVTVAQKATDATGHVTFDGLDQTGATSYFALAALPRGTANASDRLIAVPAVLDSQAGARVILSGDKRDATTPAIDDYAKLVPQDSAGTPAGIVRVTLDGVPTEAGTQITLFDAATMKPMGVQATKPGAPNPADVRAQANYAPRTDLPAGTLEIEVKGGMGQATDPLTSIVVQLVTLDGDQPIAGAVATTGADGKAKITTAPNNALKAVLVINGKQMASAGIDLSTGGGKLDVTAQWAAQGRPEATFVVPAEAAGHVVFAQTVVSKQTFRSLPFQLVAETGTHASVYVYPRTLFTFSVHSFIEDQLLAVQGTFEVTNYSWAPYRASPDGLLIKLPSSHKGGIIAPQDQNDVAVAQGEGFRILRPIPPGGRKFRAGFSLPVEGGDVVWDFELPMGTWQSSMEIRQNEGMRVKLPPQVVGETRQASTGEPWFVIDTITLERGQPLLMTITGLPADPMWKRWVPRVMGVLVLITLLGGIGFALFRPRSSPAAEIEARRSKLLDELVAIDRDGAKDAKERHRRVQIIDELERLWGT